MLKTLTLIHRWLWKFNHAVSPPQFNATGKKDLDE